MITNLLTVLIVSATSMGEVKPATAAEESLHNAARSYRIQVYDTFHLDRPEFDRRRGQWLRLAASWEAAGKPDRDVPALLHWLEIATANSQPKSIASLPELPRIVADNSHRRTGSARQTITQRLATDKVKALRGSIQARTSEPNGDSTVGTAESHSASPVDSTTPKARQVSATSTLNRESFEGTATGSETAPVGGSNANGPFDADTTGDATDRSGLYDAYGERLGRNLGNFAAALVRHHARQEGSERDSGEAHGSATPGPTR